jgi:FAD binding domain
MAAPAYNLGFASPDRDVIARISLSDFGFVIVDQLGRRYDCETALESHSASRAMMVPDRTTGEFLRCPSYLIFDETTRLAGPFATRGGRYSWTMDNGGEIQRGWIQRADSIQELAELAKLPIDALVDCVSDFNRCAAAKESDRFARPPDRMRSIDDPPFYSMPITAALVNTQGGPRRDARGQIVRPDGSPISGLYSAGELGSVWNRLYPSGGNVAEAIASARLAVRSALEDRR